MTNDAPELRIIPDELWQVVQARHPGRQGVPFTGKKKLRVFSGLLRCGVCGSGMSIVGAKKQWVSYGCSANHTKGPTICANRKTISEGHISKSIMGGLLDYIQNPSFTSWVEEATAATERALNRMATGGEELRLTAAVRAQQAKVEKTLSALIDLGVSEAGRARLAAEEDKLRDLRRQLASVSTPPARRIVVDLQQVAQAFQDIEALVLVDPLAARARLARYLDPVVLTPVEEDGETHYVFDISLKNSTATLAGGRVLGQIGCGAAPFTSPETKTASRDQGGRLGETGCGGRI